MRLHAANELKVVFPSLPIPPLGYLTKEQQLLQGDSGSSNPEVFPSSCSISTRATCSSCFMSYL